MQDSSSNSQVVISGLGVLTSIGHNIDEFWESLLAGKSGIERVTRFEISEYSCQVGAEIRDFDPTDFMDAKEVRRNDRFTHYAVAATRRALEDGNLDTASLDPTRFGVIIGSGIGGMETIENQSERLRYMGPRKVSPFTIPSLIGNIASGVVAIDVGAQGPSFGLVSACATGSHAIGESMRLIRNGDADIIVAGGSEAAITPLSYAGFCNMKAMTTSRNDDPHRASRPFDKTRDGFVMGEGSGVVILESLEHARKRNAKIYCEVSGYAATCDAFHVTSPDPTGAGLVLSLRNAMSEAGIEPEEVDYINAHGTSTPYNDRTETKAIKQVFGDRSRDLLMSSTKSMTGHLLGAAGGIEAAVCAKAIETGDIPPTINYEVPDPDCDLNYVPNVKTEATVNVAVSNNLGFGGQNATLVLKRVNSI
jgi:3-oxoacyl-[acyl-carrier-protein] synthase II